MRVLHDSAPAAAQYLAELVSGTLKQRPSGPRIDAAKYIIDQVEGKPRQKVEAALEQGLVIRLEQVEPLQSGKELPKPE